MEKRLSREDLKKILYESDQIGNGAFGFVKPIDYFNVGKFYYNVVDRNYSEKKIDDVIKTIKSRDLRLSEYNYVSIEIARMRLLNTPCHDLIKGALMFDDITIGLYMKWYKEYEALRFLYNEGYTREEYIIILQKLKTILKELHKERVYPFDIKEDNIMVRKRDLDVKLIDLDGGAIKYTDDKNIEMEAQSSINYKRMCDRLLKIKK